MDAADLQRHARTLFMQAAGLTPQAADVVLRRALSASYYALFHALTFAGAHMVAPDNGTEAPKPGRADDFSWPKP